MRQVAERYHALLTELLRSVESARKHGLKPQNDVLKVRVKLNESELNLRRTENALRLATMNLCHLIGRPLTDRIEVADDLPDLPSTPVPAADLMARPEYRLLDRSGDYALLELRPVTGRTHQLRVHCASLGCPILGDRDYGRGEPCGLQLCAAALTLPHPLTGVPLELRSRQRPRFPASNFLPSNG